MFLSTGPGDGVVGVEGGGEFGGGGEEVDGGEGGYYVEGFGEVGEGVGAALFLLHPQKHKLRQIKRILLTHFLPIVPDRERLNLALLRLDMHDILGVLFGGEGALELPGLDLVAAIYWLVRALFSEGEGHGACDLDQVHGEGGLLGGGEGEIDALVPVG